MLGETCQDDVFKRFEMCPEALISLNDPLQKAIVAAFIARRNFLLREVNIEPKLVLRQLDVASRHLADSLTVTSCKKREDLVLVSSILWI